MKIRKVALSILNHKLPGATGGSGVTEVDVITCEIAAEDGAQGFGFSYAIGGRGAASACAARAITGELLVGARLDHPEAVWQRLRAACNRTGRGPNFVGLAAVDVALWDLHARRLGVSLGEAMGGAQRPVAGYGSGGYRPGQSDEDILAQIGRHRDAGFKAIKLRLSGAPQDIRVVEMVATHLGDGMRFMVDMNEKGSLTTARTLMAAVAEHHGFFVEEPLPAHDVDGYRALARSHPALAAAGEHLQGADAFLPFLKDGLCAVVQPDLAMMGGLTECLRLGRAAELFGVEVMPHFLPGLFVQLAAATPSVTLLEDFPLLEPLLDGLPGFDGAGMMAPREVPGHGLSLKPEFRAQLVAAP